MRRSIRARCRLCWSRGAPQRLLHVYGPTESTTFATWHLVEHVEADARTIPIGQPISNTQVYVLNDALQPAPIGVPGELHLGGDGLARGYLDRPELTAEKFIPNPFGPGRLYKTGDLVRWLPDGAIEYLGRIDHQVKLRGFRIELGEIEAALNQHPAVQECVVLAREDTPGEKRLVAYVVLSDADADLRSHLQAMLPEYMIPSAFVMLEALPLNPNGKVDRNALPVPDLSTISNRADFVAPRTPSEIALAAIWCDVLGIAQVGVHDNFFALGGHSLLATQVISRIRQTFSVEIPLRAIFETPTVEGLASQIDALLQVNGAATAVEIPVADRSQPLPLSFAQQRLWFLEQLGAAAAYNMPFALRLDGALNVDALQQSLQAIVDRHESLRTTFAVDEGQPYQVVHSDVRIDLPVLDLRDHPQVQQQAEVERLMEAEALRPFDLGCDPMLRATLLQLDPASGSGAVDGAGEPATDLCLAAYAAPHCIRWLVDGRAPARVDRPVCCLQPGSTLAAAAALHPVCRLCRLAAPIPAGRALGAAIGLLEDATGRRPGTAATAN